MLQRVFRMTGEESKVIMKNLPFTRQRRRQFNVKEARAHLRDHMSARDLAAAKKNTVHLFPSLASFSKE